MSDIKVSLMKHAEKRVAQRMGLPKKAAKRQFTLALSRGKSLRDMPVQLAYWASTMKNVHSDFEREVVMFNNTLFVYTTNGSLKTLITVLKAPNTLSEDY